MPVLLIIATILLSQSARPVDPPRMSVPDLIRSWLWVDASYVDQEMDLNRRRSLSARLDNISQLFLRRDLEAAARAMDTISLELVVPAEVANTHRAAAALFIGLREGEDRPQLHSRWRYAPPELSEPLPMVLLVTPVGGATHHVDLVLSPGLEAWSIDLDEAALAALPAEGTMHLSLQLADGTLIPQTRWERTREPFSQTRTRYLGQLASMKQTAARETFHSRAARLRDRIEPLDLTGHVLDRNLLRAELAKELNSLKRGENPYVNRAGDTWYTLKANGTDMPVRLYAPETAVASGKPLPLLIALHGAGGNEHFFFDGCGHGALRGLADDHGMLVACPSTYAMITSMDSTTELVDHLATRYSIDRDRIFLLGHSLGGMTAMGLAAGKPELIEAVVAIAGGAPFPTDSDFPRVLAYAAERDYIVSGDMIESSATKAHAAGAAITPRRPDGTGHLTIVMEVLPESVNWLMNPEANSGSP